MPECGEWEDERSTKRLSLNRCLPLWVPVGRSVPWIGLISNPEPTPPPPLRRQVQPVEYLARHGTEAISGPLHEVCRPWVSTSWLKGLDLACSSSGLAMAETSRGDSSRRAL